MDGYFWFVHNKAFFTCYCVGGDKIFSTRQSTNAHFSYENYM
jgi:hypothetical protein